MSTLPVGTQPVDTASQTNGSEQANQEAWNASLAASQTGAANNGSETVVSMRPQSVAQLNFSPGLNSPWSAPATDSAISKPSGPLLEKPALPPGYNPLDGFKDGTIRFVVATRGGLPNPVPVPGIGNAQGYAGAAIINLSNPGKDFILWGAIKTDQSLLKKIPGMGDKIPNSIIPYTDTYVGTITINGDKGITAFEGGYGRGWAPQKAGIKWWPFENIRAGQTGDKVTGGLIVGLLGQIAPTKVLINKTGLALQAKGVASIATAMTAGLTGIGTLPAIGLGFMGGLQTYAGTLMTKNDGLYIGFATNLRGTTDDIKKLQVSGPGGLFSFRWSDVPAYIGRSLKEGAYKAADTWNNPELNQTGRKLEAFFLGNPTAESTTEILSTPAFIRLGVNYPDQSLIETKISTSLSSKSNPLDPMQIVSEAAYTLLDSSIDEQTRMNALEILNADETGIQKDERMIIVRKLVEDVLSTEVDGKRYLDTGNVDLLKVGGRYRKANEIGLLFNELQQRLPPEEFERRANAYADSLINEGITNLRFSNGVLDGIIKDKLSKKESVPGEKTNSIA